MVRVRHLIAWLVIALLPLQALAAAAKLCCADPHLHATATAAPALAPAPSVHPHAVMPSQPSVDAAIAGIAADTELHDPRPCAGCASLCHAVAITPSRTAWNAGAQLSGDLVPPLQPLATRPFPVADKPPRG